MHDDRFAAVAPPDDHGLDPRVPKLVFVVGFGHQIARSMSVKLIVVIMFGRSLSVVGGVQVCTLHNPPCVISVRREKKERTR